MKTVMYHYIRPASPDLPHFPFLRLADFERQLDHFAATYGFVGRDACRRWLDGDPAPRGVLLTFDDGLIDHLKFVLPVLQKRGLFGLFYVLSGPASTGTLLDVHKLHLALGRLSGEVALAWLRAHASDLLSLAATRASAGSHYAAQNSDAATAFVKQLFNWVLSPEERRAALDALLDHAFSGKPPDWRSHYMDEAGLRALAAAGMGVGSHGHSHEPASRLSPDQQRLELETSFAYVERAGGSRAWGYCHPYGSADAITQRTRQAIADAGCPLAFAVAAQGIDAPCVAMDRYALPRHNCNAFPHGIAITSGKNASVENPGS